MTPAPGRPGATLDAVLFAAAAVAFALGLPLGLARVENAPHIAAAIALDSSSAPGFFGLLFARMVAYLPLGDLCLRANLASAVIAAVAVALCGRLCLRAALLLRPLPTPRHDDRIRVHEALAVIAASVALTLTLAVFDVGSTAGSAAATWALIAAGLLVGFALLRDCTSAAAGCGLAGLAGLSAGVDGIAGPLLWPLLVTLTIWSLRKGARWPLLAPLAFVAAWGGATLASAACSVQPSTLAGAFSPAGGFTMGSAAKPAMTALEGVDELGVIGIVLAVIGLVTLAVRAPVSIAWLVLTLVSATAFAHPSGTGAGRAALPVALGITAVLACAGLLQVAGRLGRARLAAAVALAVMLVLTPALDGGRARWFRRSPSAIHLLDRAFARPAPRSIVAPGTVEMGGLFRLGRAMGLRPDLVIGPYPAAASRPDHY